ncbi:hypothetical protein [Zooshikella harenae]|uniref:CopG family transcriptional regulator n=1 Tax=Zooshikella harenae TaxID=2827238 RepID=A0ABS5ZJ15_9GAMM|nr:hypothetical protein [Zooshikella harenae]MBU2714084.1 hypothetical protein [Zooshikella harenae]
MPIKKPSQRKPVSAVEAERLADELADRPYSANVSVLEPEPQIIEEPVTTDINDELTRTTISLPLSLLNKIEDLARDRKRAKSKKGKNNSAIIREAVELYFKKIS